MTLDAQLKKFWRYGVLDLDSAVGRYLTWDSWERVPETYRKDFQNLIDHARTDCCTASKWVNNRNYSLHRVGDIKQAQSLQPRTKGSAMIMYIFRDVWRSIHPSSMLGRWEEPAAIRERQRAAATPISVPKPARRKKEVAVNIGEMISDFSDLL